MLNDGIQDGRDVSWIYDADVERLAGLVEQRSSCRAGVRTTSRCASRSRASSRSRSMPTRGVRSTTALLATPAGGRLEVVATYTAMLEVRELLASMSGRRALLGGSE